MADESAQRDWMPLKEAARILDISEDTARKMFDRGELLGYRSRPDVGNRRVFKDSVEEARRRQRGESDPN